MTRHIMITALAVALMLGGARAQDWQQLTVPNGARILDMDIEGDTIWLSTQSDGLMGYNGVLWVLHLAQEGGIRTNNFNYTVEVHPSGDKWVGRDNVNAIDRLDDNGSFFDKTDDSWTYYTYQEELETRRVFSMAGSPEGGMWVGQRDENHNRLGTVELLVENDDGTTADDVWYHYDNAWTPDSTSFSDDDVRSLAVDPSGALWIGYYASGVDVWEYGDPAVFADDSWTHHSTDNGLPSDLVNAIHIDDSGRVWAGTLGGLAVYDPSDGLWTTIEGLPGLQVRSLDSDAFGHIWVGTESGVAMLYGNGTVAATYGAGDGLPHDSVLELRVDREGGIVWVATVDEGTQATALALHESAYGAQMTRIFVYPNPWKEGTHTPEITVFGVPEGSEVTIIDLAGEERRELSPTEPYVWNTLDDEQNEVPSGVYIVRVETPEGDVSLTKAAVIR